MQNIAVSTRLIRFGAGAGIFFVWTAFEKQIIEPFGIYRYMPFYRVGGICAWDILAITLIFGAFIRFRDALEDGYPMKVFQGAILFALLVAGAVMASVASRETSAQATSVASAAVVPSANFFGDLKVCEIPGVHEHLLGKGMKTLVYAGEFTPTRVTPWTTGDARIFLYIISGTGIIQIGKTSRQAGPGDFFIIPKGARHALNAKSDKLRAVYFEDRT